MKNLRYMTVFPMLLILVSLTAGWLHYNRTKADMTRDLNQALEHILTSSSAMDKVLETLPGLNGSPMITFNGEHRNFINRLHIPALRDTAYISYSLESRQKSDEKASSTPAARICSDTIMLAHRTAEGTEIAVRIKAYANPTLASILSHSGGAWPLATFVTGILLLCMMPIVQKKAMKAQFSDASSATFPGLTIVSHSSSILQQELILTPMQEQLMELFRQKPSQTLSREEICAALWPRKDNPEDSLYTFISRMKSALASQSSLRIVNCKGRKYRLVDETGTNAC